MNLRVVEAFRAEFGGGAERPTSARGAASVLAFKLPVL